MGPTLGQRIASARAAAGLNRNQLARALGTSWQHVDHWEKGRTQPSLESVRRIAEVLGVSVDYLMGLRDQPERSSSALERFLLELAPSDMTAEEEQWLRAAPLPLSATPQQYLQLLESVRGVGAPKSGMRAKVDPGALEAAVSRKRGR
ncbi:MAG: helix-turn-helix domain-containing protein [Sandaracinaceae bacterium]|nr:helix-turn-helix domain-containing protein [Sandaracinaceae bacterium]